MMKKSVLLLCVFALAACSKDQTVITGKRVAVLSENDQSNVSNEVEGTAAVSQIFWRTGWQTTARNNRHHIGHLTLDNADIKLKRRVGIGYGSWRHLHMLSEPIVMAGKVYTFDTRFRITAIDIKTGRKVWRHKLPLKKSYEFTGNGGMSLENGVLYIATGDANLYAVDVFKGTRLWQTKLPAPCHAAPTIGQGKIFVSMINAEVQAFDLNGCALWSYTGLSDSAGLARTASPAFGNGIVAAAFSSGELVALRPDNGQLLWEASLGQTKRTDAVTAISAIGASPIIEDGVVYAVSHSGVLGAYDIASGSPLFNVRVLSDQTPTLAGKTLFVIGDGSKLYALDKRTGETQYVRNLVAKKDQDVVWLGPRLASGKLYVTNSLGALLTFDARTGQKIGQKNVASAFYQAPIIADGQLFALSNDGSLYIFG